MGQSVAVMLKPSSQPGIVRFELNRGLTGQGHERFASADEAIGPRPAAELARRLFATGQVDHVHVYSNVVTLTLARGFGADGLDDVMRDLYQYWQPGMEPQVFVEEAPAETAAAAVDTGGATGPEAEYLRRVPAVLVERSRAALAKWRATHG
jgi:hypothetical protein